MNDSVETRSLPELRQFQKVLAVFDPLRTDDLRPEAVEFVGERTVWTASWIAEESDYDGQWAMTPDYDSPARFVWAPLCDLRIEEIYA